MDEPIPLRTFRNYTALNKSRCRTFAFKFLCTEDEFVHQILPLLISKEDVGVEDRAIRRLSENERLYLVRYKTGRTFSAVAKNYQYLAGYLRPIRDAGPLADLVIT